MQTHAVHKLLIPRAQRYQSALQCVPALQVIPFELEGFCFVLGKVCLASPAAGPSHLLGSDKASVLGMQLAGIGVDFGETMKLFFHYFILNKSS